MMDKKSFIIWTCVAVVLGLSVWGMAELATRRQPNAPAGSTFIIDADIQADEWLRGNLQAKNILIEYSDLQCPACRAYEPLLKQLLQEHADEVKLIYRHFPLPRHGNAPLAAYAVEAVGKQGKFWEMHDLIFERQDDWAEVKNAGEIFEGYVGELGLDIKQFRLDVDSKEIKDRVEADRVSGIKNRIDGTPTFFLNGKKIQPKSYNDFIRFIQEADGQSG